MIFFQQFVLERVLGFWSLVLVFGILALDGGVAVVLGFLGSPSGFGWPTSLCTWQRGGKGVSFFTPESRRSTVCN